MEISCARNQKCYKPFKALLRQCKKKLNVSPHLRNRT